MSALGQYDGALQMFVEAPREADVAHLRFLRWLAERGRLDHGTAGQAGGEYSAERVRQTLELALPDGQEAGDVRLAS
jgi:hypothetical protein